MPLVDQATGAVLDRDLVGTLDLVEREADGHLVVVDLKTAARKYSDLQVEASLQLSIYSYATAMNGLADEAELRLRFDVLTKTKTTRASPLLDDERPRGQRPPLPPSRGDPRRRRDGRLSAPGGLALPGLPGPEPVLGVGVAGGGAQREGCAGLGHLAGPAGDALSCGRLDPGASPRGGRGTGPGDEERETWLGVPRCGSPIHCSGARTAEESAQK